jgi:NADP-dependent 3-hydroxy acid dehydrogenase YdfG
MRVPMPVPMRMPMPVSTSIGRKVALVTGASSGIGAAAGGSAEYHALDVTHAEQVRALVDAAYSRHVRVDVMVNNAGVTPLSKLEALRLDEGNRMIDVNVRGVLHGIAAALPIMQSQHHGHFINVASTGAHQVSPTAAVTTPPSTPCGPSRKACARRSVATSVSPPTPRA